MVMQKLLFTSLWLVLFAISSNIHAQEKAHRVVIHLPDADSVSHAGLMRNLKNLTEGWPELQIEVVCHGPGLDLLRVQTSRNAAQVKQFAEKGVDFVACGNTMKQKNVQEADLLPQARIVLMGLREIIEKQEAGWSYIRAGIRLD